MPKSFIYSVRNYHNRIADEDQNEPRYPSSFASKILTRSGKLADQSMIPWQAKERQYGKFRSGSSKKKDRKRKQDSKNKSYHHLSLVTRFQLGVRMSRLRSLKSDQKQISNDDYEGNNHLRQYNSLTQNQQSGYSQHWLKHWLNRHEKPSWAREEQDQNMAEQPETIEAMPHHKELTERQQFSPKEQNGLRELPQSQKEGNSDVVCDQQTRICQLQGNAARSNPAVSLQPRTEKDILPISLGDNSVDTDSKDDIKTAQEQTNLFETDISDGGNYGVRSVMETVSTCSEIKSFERDGMPKVHEFKPVLSHITSNHQSFPIGMFPELIPTPRTHRPKVVITIPRTRPSYRDGYSIPCLSTLTKPREITPTENHSSVLTSLPKMCHQARGGNPQALNVSKPSQDPCQSIYSSNYPEKSLTVAGYREGRNEKGTNINIPSRNVVLVMTPKVTMTPDSRDECTSLSVANNLGKKRDLVTGSILLVKQSGNDEQAQQQYHHHQQQKQQRHQQQQQQQQTVEANNDEVLWGGCCEDKKKGDKYRDVKSEFQSKVYDKENCNISLRDCQPYYVSSGGSCTDNIPQQVPSPLTSRGYGVDRNYALGAEENEQLVDDVQECSNMANQLRASNKSPKFNHSRLGRLPSPFVLHDQKQYGDVARLHSFRDNRIMSDSRSGRVSGLIGTDYSQRSDQSVKDPLSTEHPVSAQLLKYIVGHHMSEEFRKQFNNQVDTGKMISLPTQRSTINSFVSSFNGQALDYTFDSSYHTHGSLSQNNSSPLFKSAGVMHLNSATNGNNNDVDALHRHFQTDYSKWFDRGIMQLPKQTNPQEANRFSGTRLSPSKGFFSNTNNTGYPFQRRRNDQRPDLDNTICRNQMGFSQSELLLKDMVITEDPEELPPCPKALNGHISKENSFLGWIPVRLNNVNFGAHNSSTMLTNQYTPRAEQVTSVALADVGDSTTYSGPQSFPQTTPAYISNQRNHLIALPHAILGSKLANGSLQPISVKNPVLASNDHGRINSFPAANALDCKTLRDFQRKPETRFATPAADLLSSVARAPIRAPINHIPNSFHLDGNRHRPPTFITYSGCSQDVSVLYDTSTSSVTNTIGINSNAMKTSSHSNYSRNDWTFGYQNLDNTDTSWLASSFQNDKNTLIKDDQKVTREGCTMDFQRSDFFHDKVERNSTVARKASHNYGSPFVFRDSQGAISAISRVSTETRHSTAGIDCKTEDRYRNLSSANVVDLTGDFKMTSPGIYPVSSCTATSSSSVSGTCNSYDKNEPEGPQSFHKKDATFWENILLKRTAGTEARSPSGLGAATATLCNKVSHRNVPTPISTMLSSTFKPTDNTCPICHRSFTRPWLLKGHMRTHTGERPFQCSFPACDKAFADKSNLRSHMQIHTALSKNFVCRRCDRAFSQKRYLHKHIMEVCRT